MACDFGSSLLDPLELDRSSRLHGLDGGQRDRASISGVLAGALRAGLVADAADEVCELAGVGITEQLDVAADGVVDHTLLTVEGHARPADVAGRHHSGGPEDLSARVVAVDRLEAGLGRRHGAVVEAHRSEEHTSELQSRQYLVCRLLLEKKKTNIL